ncbi:hypothetical protein EZS27_036997, partial [termite gut metagenome]
RELAYGSYDGSLIPNSDLEDLTTDSERVLR